MGALGAPLDSIGAALDESLFYRPKKHQSPADDRPVEGQDEETAGVPPAYDGPVGFAFEESPQGQDDPVDGIPKPPLPPSPGPLPPASGFKLKLAAAIIVAALIGAK